MPGTNQWYIDRPDEAKQWVVGRCIHEQLTENGSDFDQNHNRCHSCVLLHCLVVNIPKAIRVQKAYLLRLLIKVLKSGALVQSVRKTDNR